MTPNQPFIVTQRVAQQQEARTVADERERLPSRDEVRTAVAAEFFDDVVAGLHRVPQPNEALAPAAERARHRVVR
jgi:hypothetical protein